MDDELLIHRQVVLLVQVNHLAQVVPAPGGDEPLAVHRGLHLVEVTLPDLQVRHHRRMDVLLVGKLLPGIEVRLHVDALEPVPGNDVELPDGAVVLRRVAGSDHDPALRHPMAAEDFILQKLQHGRGQRLADAVDLVQEEDALLFAGGLHSLVHGGDDLAHGVLGDLVLLAVKDLLLNEGQTQGALPGVVGHGVGHQAHVQLLGDLLHDGGLADARRAHEEHRPLLFHRHCVAAELILGEVCRHGVFDLFLGLFDVHGHST